MKSSRPRPFKWFMVFLGERLMLRIRGGPLKGCWWSVSSGTRFFRGTYETERTDLYEELLRPGQVVFDVGAHMGYYTLIASRAVGPEGKVFSFEPLPFNLRQLRRHVKHNRCANVQIMAGGVGAESGEGRFVSTGGSATGHLAAHGDTPVQLFALDEVVASGQAPPPGLIKIDVEGNELEVLKGARATIGKARPAILLSAHSDELERQCCEWLQEQGYQTQRLHAPGSADIEVLATPGGP